MKGIKQPNSEIFRTILTPSEKMPTKEKRTKKEKDCGKRFAFTHSLTTTKTFYLFELKN